MSEFKSSNAKSEDCETLRDLLPAYTLGACDVEEAQLVEQLLPRCPEVATELSGYQTLASAMLHSAPPVEPPAHLLSRLLQATEPTSQPKITLLPRLYLWLPAAAVIALLIALNGWMVMRTLNLSDTVQDQTAILQSFAENQIVHFDLTDPRENPSNARAVVLCNPAQTVAVIRAENFPPKPANYQVWLWRDDKRIDGGVMEVDEHGRGTLVLRAPEVMGNYEYVAIAPISAPGEPSSPIVTGALYPSVSH